MIAYDFYTKSYCPCERNKKVLIFTVILILVSLRADDLVFEYFGSESMRAYVIEKYEKQRGNPPSFLEYAVLLYVIGKILNNEIFSLLKFGKLLQVS